MPRTKELLVTVGDSWTYGADLPDRPNQVFGKLLADQLGSDWINLAENAMGNFWIAEQVEQFAKTIPLLEYDKIYVICTFTELGRWFNSEMDRDIDYISWFKDINGEFDKIFTILNNYCVKRIQTALEYPHVDLKIGSNFVDSIGFDQVKNQELLLMPWYRVMGFKDTNQVYVCTPAGVDGLTTIPEFVNREYHNAFKEWMIKILDHATNRIDILKSYKFNSMHPLAQGHQQWAEYILSNLNAKT